MKVIAARDFANNCGLELPDDAHEHLTAGLADEHADQIRRGHVPMGTIFSIGYRDERGPDGKTIRKELPQVAPKGQPQMSAADSQLLAMLAAAGSVEPAYNEKGELTVGAKRIQAEAARHKARAKKLKEDAAKASLLQNLSPAILKKLAALLESEGVTVAPKPVAPAAT